ncbi:MAG: hypothetical protein AAGB93_13175 [Planctomycetota bacterium]
MKTLMTRATPILGFALFGVAFASPLLDGDDDKRTVTDKARCSAISRLCVYHATIKCVDDDGDGLCDNNIHPDDVPAQPL